MKNPPAAKKIPILELVRASERERANELGYVLWPWRVKDLEREIEVTLQSVSQASYQPPREL